MIWCYRNFCVTYGFTHEKKKHFIARNHLRTMDLSLFDITTHKRILVQYTTHTLKHANISYSKTIFYALHLDKEICAQGRAIKVLIFGKPSVP